MFEVTLLFWQQEQQCFARSIVASTRSPDSMDVFLYIERGIKLNNPVNLGNVETTGCHISTKEYSFLELPKLVESG
jgi:hypothetical protein